MSRRVPVLDGFRGYAILGVVSLHLLLLSKVATPGTHVSLVTWGILGNIIDTFFIISGFVIFLPVVLREGRLGSIRDFAVGRAVRLLPAYWLSIAVVILLLVVVPGQADFRFIHRLPEILADMGALQMPIRLFDGTFQVGLGINGALWMISVIVGFYFVFPFIARSYYRHPLAGLAVAAAITLGWKLAVIHVPGVFGWLDHSNEATWVSQLIATDELPGWAFSFALGMTGAWAYVQVGKRDLLRRLQGRALIGAAVSLVACAICAYLYGRHASNASTGIIGGSTARETADPDHGLLHRPGDADGLGHPRAPLAAAAVRQPARGQAGRAELRDLPDPPRRRVVHRPGLARLAARRQPEGRAPLVRDGAPDLDRLRVGLAAVRRGAGQTLGAVSAAIVRVDHCA